MYCFWDENNFTEQHPEDRETAARTDGTTDPGVETNHQPEAAQRDRQSTSDKTEGTTALHEPRPMKCLTVLEKLSHRLHTVANNVVLTSLETERIVREGGVRHLWLHMKTL